MCPRAARRTRRQGGHLDRDLVGDLSVRHEKDGDPGVAVPESPEQIGGLCMGAAVVLAQRPVYEDAMEARIGTDAREAVLTGIRFDHFDSARAELVAQRAHRRAPPAVVGWASSSSTMRARATRGGWRVQSVSVSPGS
jgi:hypothetical protein